MYELGVQEHALVQFLKVADENSFVLESRDLPYANAEECRNVLREAYKDYIGLIHQGHRNVAGYRKTARNPLFKLTIDN